ncbi:neogenin-like [Asterias rubens]|uniref:neogenin-like n=1 Tax=Asterias rubens TaxID=7604 RepID=UPI001455CACE|nr:neogenin-like [Asterias rubens]
MRKRFNVHWSQHMTDTELYEPEAPTVIVDSTSTDYIEFAWELPCGRTGGNITEYRYKYKKATDNKFMQTTTTTDTRIRITSLTPCTSYVFQVTALNSIVKGTWSNETRQNTTQKGFGIAPTFNSSRVTSNTISITWNPIPCGSRGVRVTGYGVSLSRQDGQSKRDNLKQVPNTSVSAQFDQLSPCTTYIITVTTAQLRGEGTSFSREIETDSIVPGVVTGLTISRIQHDRLRVSWTAPHGTNPDTPCLATDYLVTYELINLEQCQEVNDAGVSSLNTTDTSVIIEGLEAYSTYRVIVTSRNEAGNGTATTRSKITGEKSKCVRVDA